MTRAARVVLMVAMLGAAALMASPAAACSGGRFFEPGIGPEEAAAAIFTGTAVKRDEPFRLFGGASSFDRIGWTFVVESVDKGPTTDRIRIETPATDGACGERFRFGQRYRVFAYRSDSFGGGLEAMIGDVTQLEPLPESERPPTEPGGLTFATAGIPVPAGIGVVLIIGLAGAAWLRVRRAAREATAD